MLHCMDRGRPEDCEDFALLFTEDAVVRVPLAKVRVSIAKLRVVRVSIAKLRVVRVAIFKFSVVRVRVVRVRVVSVVSVPIITVLRKTYRKLSFHTSTFDQCLLRSPSDSSIRHCSQYSIFLRCEFVKASSVYPLNAKV